LPSVPSQWMPRSTAHAVGSLPHRLTLRPGTFQAHICRPLLSSLVVPVAFRHLRARTARAQAAADARIAKAGYRWEQGMIYDQEVRVFIPASADAKAADVDFKFIGSMLRIGFKGQKPVLQGQVWGDADAEDTYYELQTIDGQRFLVLYLAKDKAETWEDVMKPPYSHEPYGRHLEEIRVTVPISDDVQAEDVEFELSEGQLRLGLRGREPFIDDELWGCVDLEDSNWMFDVHDGQRAIVVTLSKLHIREHWERLLKTEEGKGGLPTFQPGTRKELDVAALESLEYVNKLLLQKDSDYAKDYLNHIMPKKEEEEASGEAE